MRKQLQYNMHAAINLRAQTWSEAGYGPEDCGPHATEVTVIDFRTSIEMTGGDYEWGNIPLHVEVLMGNQGNCSKWSEVVTRANWKRSYTAWRRYIHQADIPDQDEINARRQHLLKTDWKVNNRATNQHWKA